MPLPLTAYNTDALAAKLLAFSHFQVVPQLRIDPVVEVCQDLVRDSSRYAYSSAAFANIIVESLKRLW